MPVLMSPDMAAKFKERWLTAHPEDQGTTPCSDDSLTSLHWLQNFSILNAYPERAAATSSQHHHLHHHMHHLHHLKPPGCPGAGTDSPSSPPAGDTAATGMPVCLGSPVTSVSDCARFAGYAHPGTTGSGYRGPVQGAPQPGLDIDYKTNPKVKPPFSYASLICMAMQASQQPKVTLSTIYNWITDNFCYYRHAEPSWQNSIRHNLSLNKCFMKVPRQKDEPGKGGFWQIDPQYADMFVNGIFKRRRMSANHYSGSSAQRQAKLLQGQESPYHRVQNGCPYQGGSGGASNRRKHLAAKHGGKEVRAPKSPLLGTEARGANVLRGDFDLTSVFDDVLGGNCSNFEDLDINTALSSLGCEMEVSIQGRQHPAAGLGRWCTGDGELQSHGQPPSNHHPSYGYMELDCSINMADLHLHHPHHLHQDQMLVQAQQHPLHQFEEPVALFPEQPEEVVIHPWEEIKEEAQVIPLTLDQGFGLCEGFFSEMQPWERVETYL